MLPTDDDSIIALTEITYPSKTYKLDRSAGRIMGYVDEADAVAQAVQKIIDTERYAYLVYSDEYGVELEALIGQDKDYVKAMLENNIKEAVLADDRVDSIVDFTFVSEDLDSLEYSLTVNSIYGTVTVTS